MQSVFGDLGGIRQGVEDDIAGVTAGTGPGVRPMRNVTPRAQSDTTALGMGLSLAGEAPGRPETTKEQARRILSGQPAPTPLSNAAGVQGLRDRLDADRNYRLNVAPNMPTDTDPPEVQANKLAYLDLLAVKGAGMTPGAEGAQDPGGLARSPVDQNRDTVAAMARTAAAQPSSPQEADRLALMKAMQPLDVPASGGTAASQRPRTTDEILSTYLEAGGQPNAAVDSLLKQRADRGNFTTLDEATKKAQELNEGGMEGVHVVTKPGGTYDIEIRPRSEVDASQKVQNALDLAQEELAEAQTSGDQEMIADAQSRVDHYTERMDKLTQTGGSKGKQTPKEELEDMNAANSGAKGPDLSKPITVEQAAALGPNVHFIGMDGKPRVTKGKPTK
jgi:hypothetical protein